MKLVLVRHLFLKYDTSLTKNNSMQMIFKSFPDECDALKLLRKGVQETRSYDAHFAALMITKTSFHNSLRAVVYILNCEKAQ